MRAKGLGTRPRRAHAEKRHACAEQRHVHGAHTLRDVAHRHATHTLRDVEGLRVHTRCEMRRSCET